MYAIRSYYVEADEFAAIVVAGIAALMGVSHAEETKKEKVKKPIAPEILAKYDKDKDGKLNRITSYNVCYTKLLRRSTFIRVRI